MFDKNSLKPNGYWAERLRKRFQNKTMTQKNGGKNQNTTICFLIPMRRMRICNYSTRNLSKW